jgi:hypothetical protein
MLKTGAPPPIISSWPQHVKETIEYAPGVGVGAIHPGDSEILRSMLVQSGEIMKIFNRTGQRW